MSSPEALITLEAVVVLPHTHVCPACRCQWDCFRVHKQPARVMVQRCAKCYVGPEQRRDTPLRSMTP